PARSVGGAGRDAGAGPGREPHQGAADHGRRDGGEGRVSEPLKIAAVGDIHFSADSRGVLKPALERLPERADLLLLAGDLTRRGLPKEAEVLAEELHDVELPVLAVLGNHDY